MKRTLLIGETPQESFAGAIALVTHPVVIGTFGLLTIVDGTTGSLREELFYIVLLTILTFFPAALYLFLFFKGNVAEMLELIDREARLIPYILMIAGALGAIFVLDYLGAPRSIFIMTLVLLINEVVLGTINFWTKVSIHTATATFTALTLGYLASPYWYSLLFLLPLIAWARVVRKRHTVKQVVGGVVFASAITGIVLFICDRFIA